MEKLRLEDAKEERKLAEQRAQIKREFDEDGEIRKLKRMKVSWAQRDLAEMTVYAFPICSIDHFQTYVTRLSSWLNCACGLQKTNFSRV